MVNKNVELLKDLRAALGLEQFKAFVELHSGETIYLPNRGEYISVEERNEAIKKDFFGGLSYRELANKYVLAIQTIYKIAENRNMG